MINEFLIDFYSKKAGQEIDQDKINLINKTYGDDYDLLINDLYSKYDTEGIDDKKLELIKNTYDLYGKKPEEEGEPEVTTKENDFIPDPSIDYENLPMMDRRKVDYDNWKKSQELKKVDVVEKIDPVTNLPLEDVSQGVNKPISINSMDGLFDKSKTYDDYEPENVEAYNIIDLAENRFKKDEKGKDDEYDELLYYYPNLKKTRKFEGTELIETYYDKDNVEVNKEQLLAPIHKELDRRNGQKLRNSFKPKDVKSYIDINLNSFDNYEQQSGYVPGSSDAFNLQFFYENDGELTEGAKKVVAARKREFDKGQFKSADRNAFNKYKETGEINVEALLREKANAGEKLYDEKKELINITKKANLSKGEASIVISNSKQIQESAPTVDAIEAQLEKAFFELLAIDKKIALDKDRFKDVIDDVVGFFGFESFGNFDAAKVAGDGSDQGFYGSNLRKIGGKDPLAIRHNQKLMEILSLSRAIKLNSNIMTIEEESVPMQFVGELQKSILGRTLTGDDMGRIGLPQDAAKSFSTALESAGLKVDEDILELDINNSGLSDNVTFDTVGDALVTGAANLTPLLLSIAIAKGFKGEVKGKPVGIKPTLSKIDAWFRAASRGKSPTIKKFYNVYSSVAKEVLTLSAANQFQENIFNQEKMGVTTMVSFGVGNSAAAGVSKAMFTRFIPYFSRFAQSKMGIVTGAIAQPIVGGVTATSVGKFATGVDLGINYWKTGDKVAFKQGIEDLKDINHTVSDLLMFSALAVRGPLVTQTRDRLLAVDTRSRRTIDAAKALGIKEFSTEKEILDAVAAKTKELGVDKMNFMRLNSPEVKEKTDAIKLAAETLRTQNNLVEAKKIIKQQTNSEGKTDARLSIIAKKIMLNENLNSAEVKELAKFSDTHKGNDNYNTRKPVEALSFVIADKMGIDRNSDQYKILQGELADFAEIGNEANKLFKGESKQIKAQKDLFIKRQLEQRDLRVKEYELIQLKKENPNNKAVYDIKISENAARFNELQEANKDLLIKKLETERSEYQSDVDFVKAVSERLKINFKELSEASFNKMFKGVSDAIYNPNDNTIFINKDSWKKTGAVSAASHELAHALLRRSFKDAKGNFTIEGKAVINDFISTLSNEQRTAVEKRLKESYEPDSEQFKNKQYEEYLTVFLDAVKRGDVKMNDSFSSSFASLFKGKEIDLSTGKGVKGFLDLLNKSSKKGALDVRIEDFYKKQEAEATEAVEGNYFKSKSEERAFGKEFDEKSKINVTKKEWDAGGYGEAFKLVDEGMLDGQIIQDVGKKKIPIRGEKIVIQDKEFTKAEFIEDVRSEIKTVIRNFNPEVNESLLGWVNNPKNFPNKRKIVFEAYEKIALGEKAARGEGGAELTLKVERPAEPFGAGRTNSLNMLSPGSRVELFNEIRNKITDEGKYPFVPETMDAYLGTFDNLIKDIPYIAAKELKNDLTTFGKEVLKDPNFSFREEAIVDPKKNLNIPEAKVAQRWLMSGGINPNFAKAIDLMPYNNVPVLREYAYKGNTTERIKHPKSRKGDNYINISASSGKINQPTGIDRNIKRDFFTKTDQRIGNDFLWTKNNFSEEYFLSKVGIKDKKKEESFTQRESEAQTLKGVLRYVTKEMTLKAVSERAEELGLSNQVNNLRSAKNVYSASNSKVIRGFEPAKQKDFIENKISDIAQEFKIRYSTIPTSKEIREVVNKYLTEDFYTTADKQGLTKAFEEGLKKASARVDLAEKASFKMSELNVEKFLEDHFKEIIEGDFERINEDYLGLRRGEIQEVSTDPEVQRLRRERDEAAWDSYMQSATDKFEAARVLASLTEQYTNTSTIGGKRHVYWGGTANFRAGLNNVINKYGINLTDKNQLTEGNKSVKVKKYGGSNFHNSETFIKQAGLNSNSKVSDYKSAKVKERVEEYDKVALEARKFLEAQILNETQAFMNGEIATTESGVSPEAQMGIAMMALKNSMGSVLRLAAPVRGIYVPIKGEKLSTKNTVKIFDAEGNPVYKLNKEGKFRTNKKGDKIQQTEKLLVWEHNKSAEKMLLDLLKVYSNKENLKTVEGTNRVELNKKGKTELEAAYEDFYVNIIPAKMDGVLRRTGYEVLSPIEGTRYYNRSSLYDPNMRAIYNFKTGKVEGEAWAKSAEIAINPKLAKENLKNDPVFFASNSNTRTNADFLNHAKNNDKALELAKKANKTPKKIRVFDFDDTLAKSKSLVFYNRPNTSGKPSPKRKAIFMIGGPGSGKSNIGKGLELGREGWKVVNQDIFIEAEKAKVGLPEVESMYSKEQKSQRSKIGFAGRKAAEAKMEKYRQAGEGMIIDGTGASYNATMKKVNKLKEQGYEVFMVHAETSTEAAMARNKSRKERSLPDFIVEKTSKAVQESVKKYREELGDKFIEIDTETIEYGKPLPKDFVNKVKTKVYENERGVLNAEEFARDGKFLIDEGAVMDFSDFNIVREGERGPMFKVAEKIRDARGTDDVFVLTARAPEAQQAIHEFLKSEGLEIPLENITGLGNSTGEAKAQWLVSKAAEGYNDFFFADDAMANVKAVKEALEPLDIKSKTQQVFASNSENRSLEFNKLLEESTGIEYYKEYSAAKAKTIGASKGKFKFFIPHSAEDFVGLIYPTLTKGKLGDKQMAWYKENLLNPYSRAMDNLSKDRVQLLTDFKELKKQLNVPKDLRKEAKTGFTKEQAVRVYLFEKAGFGKELDKTLSQTDKADLLKVVESDATLKTFAEQIFNVTKGDGYSKPGENWLVGTITTDLLDLINTGKRSKYLEEWQNNVDQIYSKENLNKLEAIYGTKYREALENILARMKAGKNRLAGGNRLSNQMLDYVNGSNAAIMFFNVRSAALQMISNINYVNWSFNNPLKAGAAVANQPQYWKDVTKLLNSDYLMDRRNGLKLNINESEIADAASTSKNKFKAGIQYILQKGYLPTQYADSFAIATGGATYYRNRINDLIKNEGKTLAEAEKQALIEWRQKSEESQQSADPSRISSQQASDAGRLILMFANTPMQYARMQKRAFQDLVNGRGDAKSNVSKIIYYGFVQNMLFNGLQNALFKIAADEDQTFENNSKAVNRTFNGMLDGLLRGVGIGGAAVSVGKNFLLDIYERSNRQRPEYVDAAWKLTQFSPPVSSKISKIKQAAYPFDNKKMRQEIYSKGFSLDNPATMSGAKVISATTNIPLDRLLQKYDNIDAALAEDTETWQSIAMLAGWPKWNIMAEPEVGPMTNKQKADNKINKSKNRVKAATGSTDFETLKKLNKAEQVKMLKDLGYGTYRINKAKKEADRIKLIQNANKK